MPKHYIRKMTPSTIFCYVLFEHEQREWIAFKCNPKESLSEFYKKWESALERDVIQWTPRTFLTKFRQLPDFHQLQKIALDIQKSRIRTNLDIIAAEMSVSDPTIPDSEKIIKQAMCNSSIGWLKNRTRLALHKPELTTYR